MAVRVLAVSAFLPSRESGGRVRLRALLRGLAASNAVSLLCLAPPSVDPAVLDEVRATYDEVVTVPDGTIGDRGAKRRLQLRSLLSTRSYERLACERPALQAVLERMCARTRYDVVHVEGFAMAGHVFPDGVPVVLDEQNVEYDVLRRVAGVTRSLPRKAYNLIDALKLRRDEERAWRSVDACALTSERDAAFVRQLLPAARVAVVPNGVDVEAFAPRSGSVQRGALLFFGELGYYPNTDAMLHFVRDVLPLLRRTHPAVKLVIVGPSAPRALRRLASPDVVLVGAVDDVRPHIAAAHAMIVPLRVGGGTRLKILEAMAMGKPVVSTRLGAEGLELEDEREILLADDAAGFAGRVARLLDEPELAVAVGAAARRRVEADYGWTASVRRLELLYASVARAGAAASGPQPSSADTAARAAAGRWWTSRNA